MKNEKGTRHEPEHRLSVVDLTSYKEYHDFEDKLHAKNFNNDTSEGAPICRYVFEDETVDFMPKVDTVIGKSNRWYPLGIKHKLSVPIGAKTTIFIMPVSYLRSCFVFTFKENITGLARKS